MGIVLSNAALLSFPSNGNGGAAAKRGSTSAITTVFGLESVTDTAAAWTLTGVAAGDYVFTSDGYWSVVISYAPAAGNNVLTTSWWRKPGFRLSRQDLNRPADGSTVQVYSPVEIAGFGPCTIQKLQIMVGVAADTVTITSANGTVLLTHTVGAVNDPGIDFGDDARAGGWDRDQPFAIQSSNAQTVAMAVYKSGGRVG